MFISVTHDIDRERARQEGEGQTSFEEWSCTICVSTARGLYSDSLALRYKKAYKEITRRVNAKSA